MGSPNLIKACFGSATDIGTTSASSFGTQLTASSSTNTKGAYSQLIASTALDTDYLLITIGNASGSGQLDVDIAVGGSGSEVVILADLGAASGTGPNEIAVYAIPFSVPAGTRISARCQSTVASDKALVGMFIAGGDFQFSPFSHCDTYGFNSGTSFGTNVDPGGSANTKGSYSQITASTTRDHFGLMWSLDADGLQLAAAELLVDIAVGAAASEVVILPNIQFEQTAASGVGQLSPVTSGGVIPVQIPSGTRLSVRAQSTDTTSTSRKFNIRLHGFS